MTAYLFVPQRDDRIPKSVPHNQIFRFEENGYTNGFGKVVAALD